MKVVIDGRMYNESGVGRYIRNLIAYLQIFDSKNEYFILLLKTDYNKLDFKKNFKKILADFRWYGISEQTKLPKILNELQADLVHFPHFNVPIFYKGRFIVTIHDLIHQHFQMKRSTTLDPLTYKLKQIAYKKVFKNAIKRAQKILVPSNYVKDLLVKEWNASESNIVITYESVDEKILSVASKIKKEEIERIMKKYSIKQQYLFYVGNAHPHKNVEGFIKTFLKLKEIYPSLNLVLSGHDHYFWQRVKKEFTQKDIIYTGFVADEELVALYKNAETFVMPSFEEGFGIPLLEAMACGCPVVSSDAGSLLEVGGEAALYFDPGNMEDMEDKINQVLRSEKKRLELIEKGKKRVKLFNWDDLARKTLEVYKQCVLQ